ncbi:MAG TPA: PaaI family thioesterase [Blastocatellia bacterium]|nr:PaaI family thioesterase [Blastocatellia bacterium]
MPDFNPPHSDYEARVRNSFALQGMMTSIGASLAKISPGEVEIQLPFRDDLTQQNGFLHAAAVTAIVDSACGYAAYTLTEKGDNVLTIEFKVNLLAPAKGDLMIARGRVIRPGRSVTVCAGDVFARTDGEEKMVATMLATIRVIRGS